MQKMSDDPIVECVKCGGALHKVLHPVAIHFKGSGFYTTDYGKGSGRRTGGRDSGSDDESSSSNSSSSASEGSSGGDGDSVKVDKKPPSGEGKSKEKQKAT